MVIVIVILMISGIETIGYKYKNSKIPTDDRADGPIEILYYHSEDLTLCHAAACAVRITNRMNDRQKAMLTTIQIDRHTDTYKSRQTHIKQTDT